MAKLTPLFHFKGLSGNTSLIPPCLMKTVGLRVTKCIAKSGICGRSTAHVWRTCLPVRQSVDEFT